MAMHDRLNQSDEMTTAVAGSGADLFPENQPTTVDGPRFSSMRQSCPGGVSDSRASSGTDAEYDHL
jgi:hypothetical protein